MLTALLLLILGVLAVAACFLVPGPLGIALAVVGSVLLWCATLAALKHIGWF
jgi:hypothetical protein